MEARNLMDESGDDSSVSVVSPSDDFGGAVQLRDNGQSGERKATPLRLRKQVSLVYAITVVAGSMIGSGIFFTPYKILDHSGSTAASLSVWVAAGVIALCGGLCYCELGSSIPKSGGEYVYLTRAYGQLVGFLYVWSSALLVRPLSLSIILLTFSKYVVQPFYTIECPPPRTAVTLIGIATAVLIGVVNIVSVKATMRLMNALLICKVTALAGIVVMGVYWAVRHKPEALSTGFEGTVKNPSGIGLSFYSALWAYSGWTDLNYIAEEVKHPHKNVPRAITFGVVLVIVCYIVVNLAFLAILEKSEFTDAVAIVAGEKVLGRAGLIIIPLCVASSTLGSASSSCMTASRVWFAGGRQGHLPTVLALLHREYATPIVSLMAQTALTCVCIAIGTLESLVDAFSFIAWIIYVGVFISVYILRRKEPNLKRPFKVWVWLPAFMTIISIFLVIVPLIQQPLYFLIIVVYVPGVVVYFLLVRNQTYCTRLRQLNEAIADVSKHLFNAAEESCG